MGLEWVWVSRFTLSVTLFVTLSVTLSVTPHPAPLRFAPLRSLTVVELFVEAPAVLPHGHLHEDGCEHVCVVAGQVQREVSVRPERVEQV